MSLEDLGIRTPEDVRNYISDGSGREPKIIESSPEEVRDINIRYRLIKMVRELSEEYGVSRKRVFDLAKEIDYE